MVETLDKIRARGSHGVMVKAPDTDLVAEAIDRLTAKHPGGHLCHRCAAQQSRPLRGCRQP